MHADGRRTRRTGPGRADRGVGPAPGAARAQEGKHAMTAASGPAAPAFGALLRRYRERAGRSQEELAEDAGLTSKAISALERGERRRPYPATVRRLAEALGLAAEERAAFLALVPPRGPAGPAPEPTSDGVTISPLAPAAGAATDAPGAPGSAAYPDLPTPLTPLLG